MRSFFKRSLPLVGVLIPVILLGAKVNTFRSSNEPLKGAKPVISTEINYQGWLGTIDDTTGIDGKYNMIFRFYNAPTTGTLLWTENHDSVQVARGLFNVLLGNITPIPDSLFNGNQLYLETQVGSEMLSPRKKMTSVGFAVKSKNADNSINAVNSDTANYILGSKVSGKVSQAIKSDTATYALSANVQYVDSARVSANSWKWNNNSWGTKYPQTYKADTAGYVTGANVNGKVSQAYKADTAGYVTGANVNGKVSQAYKADTADMLDGLHGSSLPQLRYNGTLNAGNTVSLIIPSWTLWNLQLSSGWPDYGGVCNVLGFENDRFIAITYNKYNGDGTSAAGGGEGGEASTTTLVSFGNGSYVYTVQCPGEATGDHNIVLTATGVELRYRLIY